MSNTKLLPINQTEFNSILLNASPYGILSHYLKDGIILIENRVFEDDLNFNNQSAYSIEFKNCKIKQITTLVGLNEVFFTNTAVEVINVRQNIQRLIANKSSLVKSLKITNAGISYMQIESPVEKVEFDNCRVVSTVKLSETIGTLVLKSSAGISISSSANIGTCELHNSPYPFSVPPKIDYLDIKQSSIKSIYGNFGAISIEGTLHNIHFNNVVCFKDITIIGNGSDSTFLFENIYVHGKLSLQDTNSNVLFRISNDDKVFSFVNRLEISTSLKNIEFRNFFEKSPFHINKIEFRHINLSKDSIWNLENIICSEMKFVNFRNFGTGNIDNVRGGEFKITSEASEILKLSNESDYADFFSNEANIEYSAANAKSLTFRQSDFGKLNFINSDFGDFELFFYSTKLNEIFLAGSTMPKSVLALQLGADTNLFHQQRLANTQLKKLHEQHGDTVAANEYFANEMNAYYSSISWKKHTGEKINLWLNKFSSNHGQSWVRGLVTSIGVSSVLYVLFCMTLNYYPANPFKIQNWITFVSLFSFYFEFLNPIHKMDNFNELVINKSTVTPLSRIVDSFSRLIISYFIFQLIQAFRKHGRSK